MRVVPSSFRQDFGRIPFIFYLYVIAAMNEAKTRHTITINEHTFQELKGAGTFGESYSDLILRLVESVKSGGNIEK